jgi:hypothetical protein
VIAWADKENDYIALVWYRNTTSDWILRHSHPCVTALAWHAFDSLSFHRTIRRNRRNTFFIVWKPWNRPIVLPEARQMCLPCDRIVWHFVWLHVKCRLQSSPNGRTRAGKFHWKHIFPRKLGTLIPYSNCLTAKKLTCQWLRSAYLALNGHDGHLAKWTVIFANSPFTRQDGLRRWTSCGLLCQSAPYGNPQNLFAFASITTPSIPTLEKDIAWVLVDKRILIPKELIELWFPTMNSNSDPRAGTLSRLAAPQFHYNERRVQL